MKLQITINNIEKELFTLLSIMCLVDKLKDIEGIEEVGGRIHNEVIEINFTINDN